MRDPNIQDALEQDLKDIAFNKAVDALIPVVKEDRTVFDGFLMDNYPDVYASDEEILEYLHKNINKKTKISVLTDYGIVTLNKDKWMEYVEDEAKRRVEG